MPDLDLTLQELDEPTGFVPLIGPMGNIQVGIAANAGVLDSAPIQIGIASGAGVRIEVGIAVPAIAPPELPLAVHLGQGAVFLSWSHPTHPLVSYYELLAAAAEAGPYEKYQRGEFRERHGVVYNIPVGATAYFRLRAIGRNGASSTLVQVKRGRVERPLVSLKVQAIRNSMILSGAVFHQTDIETGMLLSMQAPSQILIS